MPRHHRSVQRCHPERDADIEQEVTEGISGMKSSGVGRMRGKEAGEVMDLSLRQVRRLQQCSERKCRRTGTW